MYPQTGCNVRCCRAIACGMARPRRKRDAEGADKPGKTPGDESGGATATAEPPPEIAPDTSVGAINYEEADADVAAPMNPRVRLKTVVAFRLHLVVVGPSGDRQYHQIEGPAVHARMTERDVYDLNGPGTYRASWYRPDKRANGVSGVALCGVHEFTLHMTPGDAERFPGQPPNAVNIRPMPGRPNAIAETQRIVPDGFDSVHQWVFMQLDVARMDREEILSRLDKAFDTIVALSSKNGEMATQNAALAASIVSTMHAANQRDIDSRLGMARELVDMRQAMLQMQGSGGMEKLVAQYAARLADRFIPPTNAKPDAIANTLDKVDKTLPKLNGVADEMTAMKAQMAEVQSFLREARPAMRKLSAMTGGEEGAPTEPEPTPAASPQPTAHDAPESVDV